MQESLLNRTAARRQGALAEEGPFSGKKKPGPGASLLAFLAVISVVPLTISMMSPPRTVPANISPLEFSSDRAMAHLRIIAEKPRPIGSSEQARGRGYIVDTLRLMGLNPEIQQATIIKNSWAPLLPVATVQNVVAKLKGANSVGAILLAAHFDSVPNSPGASDNGVAVAALLETTRALISGPALQNDVILLFTDGEEIGLMGARAFVKEHRWAKDVRLALNFDARGNSGPVYMFETSGGNGWLIERFAKTAPHPIASSYMDDIYKMMPNDTDLTVFRQAGISGLNFAYIGGQAYYHSMTDSVDNTDQRSLQHCGSYALALARELGNSNLKDVKGPDATYFDVAGSLLITYPKSWGPPLAVFTTLCFASVLTFGLKKKRLRVSGIAMGFSALLLSLLSTVMAMTFLWWVIRHLYSGGITELSGGGLGSDLLIVAFIAATLAITSIPYIWLSRKHSIENLSMGVLLWWLLAMLFAIFYLPGGAYLFTWPLLFSLLYFTVVLIIRNHELSSPVSLLLCSVCAILGTLLIAPAIYGIYSAIGLRAPAALMIPVVLLAGLLIPHICLMLIRNRWLFPSALTTLSVGFIIACILAVDLKGFPKTNSIFYGLNADSGEAFWASFDEQSDEWTSQFLSRDAEKRTLPDFFPGSYRKFLSSSAQPVHLLTPDIVILDDFTRDGVRKLRLRVTSRRQAPVLTIYAEDLTEALDATVNGEKVSRDVLSHFGSRLMLRYYGVPAEGVELALELKSSKPVSIRAIDHSYGLPEIAGMSFKARTTSMMPSPAFNLIQDSTMVSRAFKF